MRSAEAPHRAAFGAARGQAARRCCRGPRTRRRTGAPPARAAPPATGAALAERDGLYLDWLDRSVDPARGLLPLRQRRLAQDRIPYRRTAPTGASTRSWSRTTRPSSASWWSRSAQQDWRRGQRAAQSRRFLCERHGRGGDRCRRACAARAGVRAHRGASASAAGCRRRSPICSRSASPRRCPSGRCRISRTARR